MFAGKTLMDGPGRICNSHGARISIFCGLSALEQQILYLLAPAASLYRAPAKPARLRYVM
jgi:hypothetical protein